ncbi:MULTISPECIES: thioredoxin family protein [Shewanella]|jgi:small redox-active disulfide protein 2|uniref:thioredoxin family protein n=1 Tax=Shewanella TaxID=22 RepID=UPI000DB5FA42|nr:MULTISPECIES: thioredoxin family protein [Shewanella]PZP34969.1 MAG: thioredoxin family protein [Shewanella oneidensis]MBB1391655.1 TM0996/MTH895 family glutaredoxin-like protein [Shewanella sp. SG44-6]MCS6160779.1 thioredoxin family protein [Shewanella baltica]MCU8072384.1 thioredoxin family protein [Shewanella sp. SM32]MCU8073840.1 thioredoxin family protein [Shewanella sp. SM29]
MDIKILGTGCTKCQKLAEATKAAAQALHLDYQLSKVTDIEKIMAYNVMSTPALVVDEQIILTGRLASVDELMTLLKAHTA